MLRPRLHHLCQKKMAEQRPGLHYCGRTRFTGERRRVTEDEKKKEARRREIAVKNYPGCLPLSLGKGEVAKKRETKTTEVS